MIAKIIAAVGIVSAAGAGSYAVDLHTQIDKLTKANVELTRSVTIKNTAIDHAIKELQAAR